MSVDMQLFEKFAGMIPALAERAQPPQMTDAERVERARETFISNLDADMAAEIESCIHCGHCADACHYYVPTQDPKYAPVRKFELLKRVYRRELSPIRWLHRLYTEDISADDLREWQELVYDSCTECGRCAMICPMGINIAGMVNVMRQGLANAGLVPPEMMAMEQEQCSCGNGSIFGVGPEEMETLVGQLSEKYGVELPLNKEKADILVTTSALELLLYNDALIATARIMHHLGEEWTLRSDGFEAANFGLLSGYESVQRDASERLVRAAEACGAKTVLIPECGHAYPSMRWEAANVLKRRLPFKVLAISEYLGQQLKNGRLKLNPLGRDKKVTFHDPCKIGRHSGSINEPRWVLEALGVDFRETESHGAMNWCCGGGAGVFLIGSAAELRQKAFSIKIEQVNATGADSVVLACGSCRLNFMAGARQAHWDKGIESLVELVASALPEPH